MQPSSTRRDFLKTTTLAAGALAVPGTLLRGETKGAERIRVGLVGSGGRGTGALADALVADPAVQVVAIGDLFEDKFGAYEARMKEHLLRLTKDQALTDKIFAERANVPKERRFSGWDNHNKVLSAEVDVVFLCAPPVFRPDHLDAALSAGKHVFMEKPVCVDPVGGRRMLELAKVADAKKLCVVAGTQRRHQAHYLEGIKRLQDGQIGTVLAAHAVWLTAGYPGLRLNAPDGLVPEDIEYQVRNWLLFRWASGDHIVEQHVHNLDVVNWALGGLPVSCTGMGGRALDLPYPKMGDRYDHFSADYIYPNDLRVTSLARQFPGTNGSIFERFVGTKGILHLTERGAKITGETPWEAAESPNPYVQEHKDLIAAVRSGTHVNETTNVTTSTLTAILGRTAAYTGRSINYSWLMNKSAERLSPEKWEFARRELTPPPIPGKTEPV